MKSLIARDGILLASPGTSEAVPFGKSIEMKDPSHYHRMTSSCPSTALRSF